MKTRTLVIGTALLLALAGTGWLPRAWLFPPGQPEGTLKGYGRIEGTEVTVGSKVTGQILAMPIAEGDLLRKDAVIAVISADETKARLAQADAKVGTADGRAEQAVAKLATLAHHADKARIDYRRARELFRRHPWFRGHVPHAAGAGDIGWFTPAGQEMGEADWRTCFAKALAVFLNGGAIPGTDWHGEPVVDDSFYLLLNAHEAAVDFTLLSPVWGGRWSTVLDTVEPQSEPGERRLTADETVTTEGRSLVLLRREDRP